MIYSMEELAETAVRIRREAARVGYNFLLVELDLAFTFAVLAERSLNAHRRDRNLRNAQKAIDSVTHLQTRLDCTQAEKEELNVKLSKALAVITRVKSKNWSEASAG